MLAFMIKAAAPLKKFPEFNSSLDGDTLVLKNYFHIGFCGRHAQRPGGAGDQGRRQKGILQISQEMNELAGRRATAGSARPR